MAIRWSGMPMTLEGGGGEGGAKGREGEGGGGRGGDVGTFRYFDVI